MGYQLTRSETWGNLRKSAASMGDAFDFGRNLRPHCDGLAFLSYEPEGWSGSRLRLCVGVLDLELKVPPARVAGLG